MRIFRGCFKFMVKEVYASEETVALAKQKACNMLGAEEKDVEFEVVQQPSKKLLGVFGGKLAQVRAVLKESVAAKAMKFLKEILYYMDLGSLETEIVSEEDDICNLKISGDGVGYVVGKHGETLDSLQYIVGLMANDKNKPKDFCKVRIEAGDYREKRKATLEALARRIANKALSSGKKFNLEPMRAYERMVIHSAVGEIEGAHSWSEGEGKDRHIVIAPQDQTQC